MSVRGFATHRPTAIGYRAAPHLVQMDSHPIPRRESTLGVFLGLGPQRMPYRTWLRTFDEIVEGFAIQAFRTRDSTGFRVSIKAGNDEAATVVAARTRQGVIQALLELHPFEGASLAHLLKNW